MCFFRKSILFRKKERKAGVGKDLSQQNPRQKAVQMVGGYQQLLALLQIRACF